MAGPTFIAKYTPGSSVAAAIIAISPTSDSVSIAPYPIRRASLSRVTILGVVPLEMSAWKPETAPQAIVMKANGKSLPAKTGPVPSMNCVTAGILSGGVSRIIAAPSMRMVPIFRKAER